MVVVSSQVSNWSHNSPLVSQDIQVVGEITSLMIARLALVIHLCYKATDSPSDAQYAIGIIFPDGNQASTPFETGCCMAELVGTSSAYR
jgi:hypothetical protein